MPERPFPVDTCGSCQAGVIWARTEHGKRTPVTASPGNGTMSLAWDGSQIIARVLPAAERQGPLYRSHFADCPNAGQHRKVRR